MHYSGQICEYDQLPASAECPFQYPGVTTRLPAEDPSLEAGSTVQVVQPDGSIAYYNPNVQNTCQHNAVFFLLPNYEAVLNSQRAELELRHQLLQPQLPLPQDVLPGADG